MNNEPKQLEIRKCIACGYSVWPPHAPGFCMVHYMGTTEAREQTGPCGVDSINFQPKNTG